MLLRLPYNRRLAQTILYAHPSWYAAHGYATVVQDVRGRWASGGAFDPIAAEAADGADTIAWAASQPWSNGRVGMYGFSYPGMLQLLAAAERPPGLQAIVPGLAPSQMREGWQYNGGAFALALALGWTLELGRDLARRSCPELEAEFAAALASPSAHYAFRPLREQPLLRSSGVAPFYFEWLAHETEDEYWAERQVETRYADVDVPALHMGGWYDSFADGTLRNFQGLRAQAVSEPARQGQRLVVGPWHHIPALMPLGSVDFGPEFWPGIDRLQLRWFDLWLPDKDDGIAAEPSVRVFGMGANRWLDFDGWPPPTTRRHFFLRSAGRANSREGDGRLSEESPALSLRMSSSTTPPRQYTAPAATPAASQARRRWAHPTSVQWRC